ncbi:hypothetical protein [Hafnia alvei]|uniref:Lipoprotein n=1 Tax=Hafnia alvei TaxID=569 RepID=A0A1C6Z107_HAFAL|nr:hypothetical protein [Hafnia alvei]NLS54532.1 hypothetical protein [Hafnia alvei]SCM52840.1 hypothetical protein BN1044_02327 [Hafnia alvei]
MKKSTLLALVPAAMMSSFAFADLPASDDATQTLIDQASTPQFLSKSKVTDSKKQSLATTKQVNDKSAAKQESSFLPFWGDEARALGYELPETFGVGVNYMNMRQNIEVDSIKLTGLPLNLDKLLSIGVGHTREKSKTESVKLDAWVLPFLNVYGLVGHTKGTSSTKITSVKLGSFPIKVPSGTSFDLDFKGTTYGGGATLVGGYENWFSAIDANYTETRFDILDGNISAFTLTPRVGYRFTTPGLDALHLAPGKLNVWVGSMYQDVQQEFKGKLSDLNLPSGLAGLAQNGRFDVKQHLQSPWNVLVGAQYEITRNFNVLTEIGFAERNSFFVSGEYRF